MNSDDLNVQLAREERTCPSCGYRVRDPLLERCPRCVTRLPRSLADCGNCTHQGNCDFARAVQVHHKK
jgi:hypothetical protein